MDVEQWLPVEGYEGIYEVSDQGRVKSLERKRRTGLGVRTVRERILKAKPGVYPTVTLSRMGHYITMKVHTLVLRAFVGPAPGGMEACHFDGDKWNCCLENLRWDTRQGNHEDRVRHGVSNRGERCGTAKLTAADVRAIRSRREAGELQESLARSFDVSQSQISQIINRRRWAHGE